MGDVSTGRDVVAKLALIVHEKAEVSREAMNQAGWAN